MNKLNILLNEPVQKWTVQQVIIFDWHDGPREGIAALKNPECEFSFELVAEKTNDDDLDERYFRVKFLPAGTIEQVHQLLQVLGKPESKVWVPIWSFSTEADQTATDKKIDKLLAKGVQTDVIIGSRDMETFQGCWKVPDGRALETAIGFGV